jgi:hypothetical protein
VLPLLAYARKLILWFSSSDSIGWIWTLKLRFFSHSSIHCVTTIGQWEVTFFLGFLLVPARAGFELLNVRSLAICSIHWAATVGQCERNFFLDFFLVRSGAGFELLNLGSLAPLCYHNWPMWSKYFPFIFLRWLDLNPWTKDQYIVLTTVLPPLVNSDKLFP